MLMQETANLRRIILNKSHPTDWVIFLSSRGNISGSDWDIFARQYEGV